MRLYKGEQILNFYNSKIQEIFIVLEVILFAWKSSCCLRLLQHKVAVYRHK